jgi:hypothetical protein
MKLQRPAAILFLGTALCGSIAFGGCATSPSGATGFDGVDGGSSGASGSSGSSGASSSSGASGASGSSSGSSGQGDGGSSGKDGGSDGSVRATNRIACGSGFCRTDQTCQAGRCVYSCTGTQVPGDYATLQAAIGPLSDRDAVICYKVTGAAVDNTVSITSSQAIPKTLTIIGVSPDQAKVPTINVTSGHSSVTFKGLVAETMTTNGTTKVTLDGGHVSYLSVSTQQTGDVLLDGVDVGGTTQSYGIYAYVGNNATKIKVQNSYFHDSYYGAYVYSSSSYQADLQFLNNTFANNTNYAMYTQNSSNMKLTLAGNIFTNCRGTALYLTSFQAGSEFTNNLLFGNTTNYAGNASDGTNYVKADPMLDNGVPPDTKPGSPARNAGAATRAPALDFYGVARGATPDIGAGQSP